MWPQSETTAHSRDLLSRVEPQSALLHCPSTTPAEECEKSAALVGIMPNGYRLLLSVPDSDPNAQVAAKSYWDAVELASENESKSLLLSAALVWVVSSLAVLLFGIGVLWVIRGFRPHP